MAQNVIIYPSGSTKNPYPHIEFSGANGYYYWEINEDGVLYSYQPNIPTSGLTMYFDAAAYDSYSGGTQWWDLTGGRYLIGEGDGVQYDGVMTSASPYRNVNQLIHTEASAINVDTVNEWWFSDIANQLEDINNNNDYYDEIVAGNYDTIFVKIYKSTQPESYYQVYSGSNASIVSGGDLRLDMVRIDGINSWDGSDIYNTQRAGYPGLDNKSLDGVVTVEFIPSRNGGGLSASTTNASLVNAPYHNPVNGGVFRFDATNEYARALDPNIRGGSISRTMIGFFSAGTSESGCIFGIGDQPEDNGGSNSSWELWNYNQSSGAGLRIHTQSFNFGTSPEYRLTDNLDKWLMAVLSYDTDANVASLKIYDDGVVTSGTSNNSSIDTITNNFSVNKSAYGSEGGGMTGNFALALYYEREISDNEIEQIYRVFSPRFGVTPAIVKSGLEMWLDAKNANSYTGGTIWHDLTENGNDGTINGPTHTDYYLDFDGTDDYVSLPAQTMYRSGGTICMLFNKDAETGGLLWGANYDRHLSTLANSFYGETASNCNSFNSPTYSAGTGNWVQYTLVFTGNSAYHYIDGVSIGETPNYGSIDCGSATTQLEADFPFSRIGNSTQYVGNFDGKISVVLKYDRPLTQTEITKNYEALKQRYSD